VVNASEVKRFPLTGAETALTYVLIDPALTSAAQEDGSRAA